MADEAAKDCPQPKPCPPCKKGAPDWLATFSDLCTLLLTFFILLLSFAKTEAAKYEAALGSIRDAFGGNVLERGEVLQPGKSPDNQPTMMDSQETIKPFPIDFLTMEGLLDKQEINRESDENLKEIRNSLKDNEISESVDVYELPEGIQVKVKDKILFQAGSIKIDSVSVEVFEKMVRMLKGNDWTIFVEGHAALGERSADGKLDAFALSSERASAVTRVLIKKGIRPDKVTTVFYGDTRPDENAGSDKNRRVEFIIRKVDLQFKGHKVNSH